VKKKFLFSQNYLIYFFKFICVFWISLQILFSLYLPFSIDQFKVFHLCSAIFVILLSNFIKDRNKSTRYTKIKVLSFFIFSIIIFVFFIRFTFFYKEIIMNIGYKTPVNEIIGLFFLIVLFILTVKSWGKIIVAITFIASLYALYGNHFSGILLHHSGISLRRFIGYTSTWYMGSLGSLMSISTTLIIYFILFGALLEALGGKELIFDLSRIIGSKFKSGTAQTAVISSALLGMITGSTASNVAMTGSVTIPLMKQRGYSADFAGGVEATASLGGQYMPPVMGVTVFIIASFTNMPYKDIVIAAFLPAFVYYLNLVFTVFVRTEKIQNQLSDLPVKKVKIIDLLKNYGHLLIPVIILTWGILTISPNRAVLYGILSLVIVTFLYSILLGYQSKRVIKSLKDYTIRLARALVMGAENAAKITIVLGCMGIIMEVFSITGFGQRLGYFMTDVAGENLFLLVGLVVILTLFFGMGMPTPGAYILTVLLSAPLLIRLGGFTKLSTHLFVFYFAVMSSITPPVAIASLIAIGISKGSFLKTSLEALKIALPGILLPFCFLFRPEILQAKTTFLIALIANIRVLFSCIFFVLFFEGYFLIRLTFLERVLCAITGVLIFAFRGIFVLFLGIGLILIIVYRHLTIKHSRIN